MRGFLFLLVFVCLFLVSSAFSQTVNENESSLVFGEKTAELTLVVESKSKGDTATFELAILDEKGVTKASAASAIKLKAGKHKYKMSIPAGDLVKSAGDDLAWYRLRYKTGDSTGMISLSELLKDDFELRVAAFQRVIPGEMFRARVRALNPLTKRPVKNVAIAGELELELDTEDDEDELTLKANGKTNGDGILLIDFKVPADVKLDDDSELLVRGSKGGLIREIDEYLDDEEQQSSVMLTADKPLYQPGQSFSVRGLYFDANNTVLAGQELEFSIEDADDKVLYREKVKTSDFGIASISWTIPANAKLGDYRVVVEADDDLKADQLTFKVSRYDLPNYSVSVKPDKTYYLPGDDRAEITVNADYLFGKPVTKGKVRVVQESERRWNWREQKYDVTEKGTVEGEADANGKFLARIDLTEANRELQQRSWKRYEDLRFAAYFTDTSTNRTEQKHFEIRLTKEPIHIYFIRHDYQHRDLPVTAYVSTFYADGTPAFCDVDIRSGNETLDRIKTNSLGAGKLSFPIPADQIKNSDLKFAVRARDKKGLQGTYEDGYYLDSDKDSLRLTTERTIHRPGDPIDVSILSTQQKGVIYVDLVKDWTVVDSRVVTLRNGRASFSIPFRPEFRGELTIAAYGDQETYYWDNRMRSSRGIIFPEQQNLSLKAKFSNATYKPADEAKVKFSVLDGRGSPAESALGIVVFDKAVEQRAQTDSEFGSHFSSFSGLMGYGKGFGNLSLKDINELDTNKPITPEVELAAEVMLAGNSYYPQIYHDGGNDEEAESLYKDYFSSQLNPVAGLLHEHATKAREFPDDEAAMRRILSQNGKDLGVLKDPWDMPYYLTFRTERTVAIDIFNSSGPDKIRGNDDDFEAKQIVNNYFQPTGAAIEKAVFEYHARTGGFVRDPTTFSAEAARAGVDLGKLKDRWGRDYKIFFEVSGRSYMIRLRSLGPNGIDDGERGDDFDIWKSYSDYFYKTEKAINDVLDNQVNSGKRPFPKNEAEFAAMLKQDGLDLATVLDGYGKPVQLVSSISSRYVDKVTYENGKQVIRPVTDQLQIFSIHSLGENVADHSDNVELARFSSVITEMLASTRSSKADVKTLSYTGARGAISGMVVDPQGAVVPGATVTATNENDSTLIFSTTTDENGAFLLGNITSGRYTVRVEAVGFQAMMRNGVQVRSQNMIEMQVTVEVGNVSATVNVVSDSVNSLNSSASVATTVTSKSANIKISFPYKDQTSTPRLREYFPETLVWQPELVTDKKGRAEFSFKMADNITTWKMYTIASTKKGKIGVAENEIVAFQPFFVDLDPPKFLTMGDEIFLPTQVRNYTDKKQNVNVTMANANWFTFLGCDGMREQVQKPVREQERSIQVGFTPDLLKPASCDANGMKQRTAVDSGQSENAVFGFKAVMPIKEGKQRVTAMAETDSDAIERPVTVRPDGREFVHTDSRYFTGAEKIDVNFPANAIANTQTAELKIYPNLMTHVAESVEGLLRRPYGCGEQTISSTYPNVMILKFADAGTTRRGDAETKESPPRRISESVEKKAKKFLQSGYERLLGYQVADGGFSYWGGKDSADFALTAYALRFLADASKFIAVDPEAVKKAEDWLIKQQRADGSWNKKYHWEQNEDANRAKTTTTYVARTLAMLVKQSGVLSPESKTASPQDVRLKTKDSLARSLAYLKSRNAEIDDPYSLSLFGFAAFDGGDMETARSTAQKLTTLFKGEAGGAYWNLESNTAFNGWGTAGRVETTALATQLLMKTGTNPDLVGKAMLFLLKNKDRYGVWYSTQTTINVLDTFVAAIAAGDQTGTQEVQVILNGETVQTIAIGPDKLDQIVVDLSGKLTRDANIVELRSSNRLPLMAQLVSNHYVDWKDADASGRTVNQSRALRLDYKCDRTDASIMNEINCSVEAERIGFQGYGMLLAEIGTPPGADVSRESLQAAMENDWSISRYDILPDRVVLYMWSKAGGTKFNFKFKPRYGINAQTPPSTVYDYYNPEAQATIAPLRFVVR